MQIIRRYNRTIIEINTLSEGDTFEFVGCPERYGVCIVLSNERVSKPQWFSLSTYESGTSYSDIPIRRLSTRLIVED